MSAVGRILEKSTPARPMTFSDKLREQCRNHGVRSAADLAARTGCPKAGADAFWDGSDSRYIASDWICIIESMPFLKAIEESLPAKIRAELVRYRKSSPVVKAPDSPLLSIRQNFDRNPPKSFAEALARCRTEAGHKQADLARWISVEPCTVSAWENGTTSPIKTHYDLLLNIYSALARAPNPVTRDGEKPGPEKGQVVAPATGTSSADFQHLRGSLDATSTAILDALESTEARLAAVTSERDALKAKLDEKTRERPALRPVPPLPPSPGPLVPLPAANAPTFAGGEVESLMERVFDCLDECARHPAAARSWVSLIRTVQTARLTLDKFVSMVERRVAPVAAE